MEKLSWNEWYDRVIGSGFAAMVFVRDLVSQNPQIAEEWKKSLEKDLKEYGHEGEFNASLLSSKSLDDNINRAGWFIFDKKKMEQEMREKKIEACADKIVKQRNDLMTKREAKLAKREREKMEVLDRVAKKKAELAAKRSGLPEFSRKRVVIVKHK